MTMTDMLWRLLRISISLAIFVSAVSWTVSLALLVAGCRSGQDVKVTDLVSEPIHFAGEDSLLFRFPSKIRIFDTLAIVQTRNDEMLQIFRYPEFEYQASLGRRGRGAGEILGISAFEVVGDTLSLMEMASKSIYGYSLRDVFDSKKEPSSIRAYKELRDPLLSCDFGESDIVSVYASSDSRLSVMSRDGSGLRNSSYGMLEDKTGVSEKIPPEYLPTLWQSVLAYDAGAGVAASATMLGDVIEIFDVSDMSRKAVVGPGGFPNVYKDGASVSVGRIDGYFDIVIDDARIYALYSGADRKEQSRLNRGGEDVPYGGDIVRVYDFGGTLLEEYHLDRHVCSICIDSPLSRIVAIDSNSENIFCSFKF